MLPVLESLPPPDELPELEPDELPEPEPDELPEPESADVPESWVPVPES